MRRIRCALGLAVAGLLAAAPPAAGLEPGHLTDDQIRIVLQARGFSEVEEVRREEGDGGALRARARRGGSRVEMRIDPRTGTVTGQEIIR